VGAYTITTFISGLSAYVLLSILSVAAGCGALKLLRIDLSGPMALALAPILTLGIWSVGMGIGVGLRLPMWLVAVGLWPLTIALVLASIPRGLLRQPHRRHLALIATAERQIATHGAWRVILSQYWVLGLCLLMPVIVLFPFFSNGLSDHIGSPPAELWSYVAYGQYLWENRRGAEGGLAPLYQYAAHISHARYIASATLGFFSPLFDSGDTQLATGLLFSWALFTFGSACAFLGINQQLRPLLLASYLLLTVVAGWIYNLIWMGNYDNAMALAYFPALIGIVLQLKVASWAWRFLAGIFVAGLLYCYPELGVVALGCTALIFMYRVYHERTDWHHWLLTAVSITVLAAILTGPFLPELFTYFRGQASTLNMQPGTRPGEGAFLGLLEVKYQPSALWGLGGEYRMDAHRQLRNGAGALLSVLAVIGLLRLLWQRRFSIALPLALVGVATLILLVGQQYAYGAYKMILIGWWAIGYALMLGVDWVAARLAIVRHTHTALVAAIVGSTLFLAPGGTNWLRSEIKDPYITTSMAQLRKLQAIEQIVGNAGVQLDVDNWVFNQWAVYFLRTMPIHITKYRAYMDQPHVLPYMQRSRAVPIDTTRYLLTDSVLTPDTTQGWKMIWSVTPYYLWDKVNERAPTIEHIANLNGIEQIENQRFFWMSPDPTTLTIHSPQAGRLRLQGEFLPGPNLPGAASHRMHITTNHGFDQTLTVENGSRALEMPVSNGETTVVMTVLDSPTTTAPLNGDSRIMVLGVKGLSAELLMPSK
jgi:hypothetical protein